MKVIYNELTKSHNFILDKNAVAILLYKRDKGLKVFVQMERSLTDHTKQHPSIITGKIEKNEVAVEAALREIEEESGYLLNHEDLFFHGHLYPTKLSDFKLHLYSAEIKGHSKTIKDNDNEYWISIFDLEMCRFVHPEIYVIAYKLLSNILRGV